MFVLNFPPGALGFLMLKTIYHHWPASFGRYVMGRLDDPGYANHDVVPDLFIRDRQTMSRRDIRTMAKLTQVPRSTVLAHDIDIIPPRLLAQARVVSVTCDARDLKQCSFLYWIKSGAHIMRYVQQHVQPGHSMEELWNQMRSFQRSYASSGTMISFGSLSHANSVMPMLAAAATAHDLAPVSIDAAWYLDNYQRSIAPLQIFGDQFRAWQRFFDIGDDYRDLAQDQRQDFHDVMEFFSVYHAGSAPAVPAELIQLRKR